MTTDAPTTSVAKRKILTTLLKRDLNRCYLCQKTVVVFGGRSKLPPNAATIDHIIPQCKGGGWNLENLALCCSKCNRDKGSHIIPKTEKGIRRQEREHVKRQKRMALFLTRLWCGIPMRGGWL